MTILRCSNHRKVYSKAPLITKLKTSTACKTIHFAKINMVYEQKVLVQGLVEAFNLKMTKRIKNGHHFLEISIKAKRVTSFPKGVLNH